MPAVSKRCRLRVAVSSMRNGYDMRILHLDKKSAINVQWVETWITPLIRTPPEGWPYRERYWYSGLISTRNLENIWLVCADWTDKTWLKEHSGTQITIGLAKKNWPPNCSGSDYETIKRLKSQYEFSCADASRWIILTDDTRDGRDGIVVADGNHRAIASALAGCPMIPVLVAVHPRNSSWLD